MGSSLNYFPEGDRHIAAIAAERGCDPREVVYDLLLEDEGRAFLMYAVAGYAEGNRDALYEMLKNPTTVMGGSDSGAHMRTICDASAQTFMLTNWVRDCPEGHPYHLPLEFVVKKQTHDTARAVDLHDRGVLAPGMKADLNVIDFDNLNMTAPEIVQDLPAGGSRFEQKTSGYLATVVSGEVTYRDGAATDALPGRLIR